MPPSTLQLRCYSQWIRRKPAGRSCLFCGYGIMEQRRGIVVVPRHPKYRAVTPAPTRTGYRDLAPDPDTALPHDTNNINHSRYNNQLRTESESKVRDLTNSERAWPSIDVETRLDFQEFKMAALSLSFDMSEDLSYRMAPTNEPLESIASNHAISDQEDITTLQLSKHSEINLVEQYDNVLNSLINDHLDIFTNYFASNLSSETSISSMAIVQLASQEINSDYLRVRAKRSKLKRSPCPASLYNNFLRQLYWNGDGGPPSPRYIFQAYKRLPYPPPRSINPVHLETLIAFFMGHASRSDPTMYLTILSDIAESGMPISIHEHSAALISLGKQLDKTDKKHHAQILIEERVADLESQGSIGRNNDSQQELNKGLDTRDPLKFGTNDSNVHALNALLSIALKSGSSSSAVEKIFSELSGRADRFTRVLMLSYYGKKRDGRQVKTQYRNIIDSGDIIDMPVLNLVMKYFLLCGYVEEAESMLHKLVRQKSKAEGSQIMGSHSHRKLESQLRSRVTIMDYLLKILRDKNIDVGRRYSVPLVPDFYTFGNFFQYYCLGVGNFNKSVEILRLMTEEAGYLPDKHIFINFYKAFYLHHHNMANEWTLQRLNYITELVCHYELLQAEKHGEHFCTTNMAVAAFRAYRMLAPTSNTDFDALERQLSKKGSRKRFYNVFTTLKKLSTTRLE
ncbi:hypothetical protein AWJ20_3995 [Sugiyamaella lignohabitans]|uniref:Uncharacterized protein n=1 Tax=Sugiyamaella lignohabitans TaxID=796027 RepID=A0A167C433_9ASCO|nr:uncharacterized protein AWJ20_3995 [Sugiyamaella lignohabitans]ANB11193.1 hypothetical protein AWJ20_3995 [Sugiyamaella lignohabitans]